MSTTLALEGQKVGKNICVLHNEKGAAFSLTSSSTLPDFLMVLKTQEKKRASCEDPE